MILNFAKAYLFRPLKRFLKGFSKRQQLVNLIAESLPTVTCVDVGASYYPHGAWELFLMSPQTKWVAVEPNKQNLKYIDQWSWKAQVRTCTTGLSQLGGQQELFVTNVDSGSSLLEPDISPNMAKRFKNLDYFFPVKKVKIDTLTLMQALEPTNITDPIFIKLDTQGTELSILKGADSLLRKGIVLGIEAEATFLAEPMMKGSGKFWQMSEYLESLGYELLHLKPIYSNVSRFSDGNPKGLTFLNECDAAFVLKRNLVEKAGPHFKASLFAFYLSYFFYEEALSFLQTDSELLSYFKNKGVNTDHLTTLLDSMV